MEVIKKMFSPEFRNRLDSIIRFQSLDHDVIMQVVEKFLIELQEQLQTKKIELNADEQAKAWLGEKGFDKSMGARPMARVIQEYIKRPLANEMLFGHLVNGGVVELTVESDELKLKYLHNEEVVTN